VTETTNIETARQEILELCSEDDFGVWELWWQVREEIPQKDAEMIFTKLIQDLTSKRLIIPKRKNQITSQLEEVSFDANILAVQVKNSADPDPESFYWFGTPA
jgi:hypothetical protein